MPKTLEQIMEEQMMAMMSQMMASNSGQVPLSTESANSDDFSYNGQEDTLDDDDDDFYGDSDEDYDENYIDTGFNSVTDSKSDEFFSNTNPQYTDNTDFGFDFASAVGDTSESVKDIPVNNESTTSADSSFFYAGSNASEVPFQGSKAVKFAFDNYNNVGVLTPDKDLFYSVTERDSFARNFGIKVGSSVNDSELLPLLIDFASNIVKDNIKPIQHGEKPIHSSVIPTPLDMDGVPTYNDLLNQNKSLMNIIKSMFGDVKKERDFFKSGMSDEQREEINESVMSSTQPFESLTLEKCSANFFSHPFEYMCYNQKKEFSLSFGEGSDLTTVSNNMLRLSECILNDIYTMVGGANRITDLMVLSGLIIVNGVSYEPILPESYMKHIPIADRTAVMSGYFANFINYKCLRDMKNLTNLSFDTRDFVYGTVRKHLGYGNSFEPKDLFIVCKSLMNLQIGEVQITRATRNDFDNLFHVQKRSSQLADWCTQQLDSGFNLGVTSIKDFWSSKAERGLLGNVWGFTWRGTATAAVGLGDASLRLSRGALKLASNVKTGINAVIEAVKQDL